MPALQKLLKTSELVRRAHEKSRELHQGQRRKTGEPYFYHTLAAAETIAEWNIDEQTVAAAFLHDVLEDTSYSIEELRKNFGDEVAFLVESVTKVSQVKFSGLERDVESLRKFILHLGQDVRAILVRLADRLDNMKTLYIMPPEKQRKIALETMEIYAPLAYRLGMYRFAGELEDLAFPYIYPREYTWLVKNVKDLYEARERYAARFKPKLEKLLKQNGLTPALIEYRAKRYTSLYKKLLRYEMDISAIHDLVALRVIFKTVPECYRALEIIHAHFPPSPIGFDDYIKTPKPNGYQSIHTNVFGPGKKVIEIQIRTEEMHAEAEMGVAARFAYERHKETPAYALGKTAFADKKISWIRKLISWRKGKEKNFKIDIFGDQMLVLSPKNDIVELPLKATVLDFAYKIHSQLGHHSAGAKVNGKDATRGTVLNFGDIIEVITRPEIHPDRSWLTEATTHHAKNKIRAELERLDQEQDRSEAKPRETEIIIRATKSIGLIPKILAGLNHPTIRVKQVNALTTGWFKKASTVAIECDPIDKNILAQTLTELKKIEGVQKVTARNKIG